MKTVLCDDHRLFAEAFAAVLTSYGHVVAAVTDTVASGVSAVYEHAPDIAVFDVTFSESSGVDALALLGQRAPRTGVVLLTGGVTRNGTEAIRLGARGFLRKDQDALTIVHTLERIHRGDAVAVSQEKSAHKSSRQLDDVRRLAAFLSPREREVLRALVVGLSTDEIAARLGVSHSTTRTHVQSLLGKLGVSSRLEAAALVAESGLMQDPGFRLGPSARL